MIRPASWALVLSVVLMTAACGKKEEQQAPKGPQGTPITTVQAQAQNVEVIQKSVGQVDSESAPQVAAEVAGRVLRIAADEGDVVRKGQVLAQLDPQDRQIALRAAQAEVNRLRALIANQQRTVGRYEQLIQEQYIPRNTLDEAQTQLHALREQLASAQAQVANASRELRLARVTAPIDGRVQTRMVSQGDYVTVGKPLFQLVSLRELRVHLPFPETLAGELKPGLPVRLSAPTDPGKVVEGRVTELRPAVSAASRAVDVIVAVTNPGDWRPGVSINGEVILAERADAVMVPEQSVVRRPAGDVVYVIRDGRAQQRVVKTGIRRDGQVEITSGLAAGETIANEGAGFLSDKAPVVVRGARQ